MPWNSVSLESILAMILTVLFAGRQAWDPRCPWRRSVVESDDIVRNDSSAAHELLVKRIIGVPGDIMGRVAFSLDPTHFDLPRPNRFGERLDNFQ
ncbi:hypothetical protein C7412_14317 [Paraburkholderia silvatlantica]|nr:hypothetical protein C7412_14317 [Paraburkholderia silvatlantica]